MFALSHPNGNHLNSLGTAHWREWHRVQDWMNARVAELVATGMHWEPATDQAYAELKGGN